LGKPKISLAAGIRGILMEILCATSARRKVMWKVNVLRKTTIPQIIPIIGIQTTTATTTTIKTLVETILEEIPEVKVNPALSVTKKDIQQIYVFKRKLLILSPQFRHSRRTRVLEIPWISQKTSSNY